MSRGKTNSNTYEKTNVNHLLTHERVLYIRSNKHKANLLFSKLDPSKRSWIWAVIRVKRYIPL
jgi:hypothetical protein